MGGSKNESNFIAVVHIDGNAMGKRVENLYDETLRNMKWPEFKCKIKEFSQSIDEAFKQAYFNTVCSVVKNIEEGNLKDLELDKGFLPIRRIITEGDDICFVTEGRIGVECAAIFIKELSKAEVKNSVDGKGYAACAGVAIVHQKYPFYKAYELAESLCSNAKRFGAELSKDGSGSDISAIDWHIEYGEIKDTLEEIRLNYTTKDGNRLEMRPYIVSSADEIMTKEKIRQYEKFRKLISGFIDEDMDYARGKLKSLRGILKEGEDAAKHFLVFNKIEDVTLDSYQGIFVDVDTDKIGSGKGLDRKVFVETSDKIKRSVLFDAIELSDTFIKLDY
ncbi:MAG: hypothetical protein IJM37_10665 [Lachnospiraceae bacterium]|nr:hypothetical protein [Lachnospiraceae bacterium]